MMPNVPWQALFSLALHALEVAAEANLGGDAVAPLLRAVVAIRNSEQRVLEDIRQDVRALLEGPWRAGDLFLMEAEQSAQSSAARQAALELARQRFIDACGNLVHDHFSRALVEYRTAVCYLCSSSAADARRWFERAYNSAGQALLELEHASAWRRQHQQVVDKARGVVRGGFAKYLLPKRLPRIFGAVYDITSLPERLVLEHALSGYERLVLRRGDAGRLEQEARVVKEFRVGLQPLMSFGAPPDAELSFGKAVGIAS